MTQHKTGRIVRREDPERHAARVVNDNHQAREVTAKFRKKLTGMRKINPESAGVVEEEEKSALPVMKTE